MDWLDILAAVVYLVVPFVLGACASYLAFNRPGAGARPLEYLLYDLAGIAVEAAQQVYGEAEKEAKKLYAMDFLGRVLPKVDRRILDAAVEAAVHRLKSQQ